MHFKIELIEKIIQYLQKLEINKAHFSVQFFIAFIVMEFLLRCRPVCYQRRIRRQFTDQGRDIVQKCIGDSETV